MDLFRLSDEVSDAHRSKSTCSPAASSLSGRPRPDPADHLQRRQERGSGDGRGRPAPGRRPGRADACTASDSRHGPRDERGRARAAVHSVLDRIRRRHRARDGDRRRIVEDHGGTSSSNPDPGEGTTVTVLLPRDARAHEAAANAAVPNGGGRMSGPRLLIVDDEASIRDMLAILLPQERLRGRDRLDFAEGKASALPVEPRPHPFRHQDAGRQRPRPSPQGEGRRQDLRRSQIASCEDFKYWVHFFV